MDKFHEAIKLVEFRLDEVAKYANEAAMKNDKEINAIYSGKVGVYREVLTILQKLKQETEQ